MSPLMSLDGKAIITDEEAALIAELAEPIETAPVRDELAELTWIRDRLPTDPRFGNEERAAELDARIAELEQERAAARAAEEERLRAEEAARAATPAAKAAAELEELRAQRPALALAALDGDAEASVELDRIEARIADAERTSRLEQLAAAERERLAREGAEAAAREAKQKADAERKAAAEFRADRMDELIETIAELRMRMHRTLVADAAYLATAGSQGRSAFAEMWDLIVVAVTQAVDAAGMPRHVMREIPFNRTINDLTSVLGEFVPEEPTSDTRPTGRPCSICTHASASAIDAAIAAGDRPLTEIAAEFGVTRHALGRHRDHEKETT